MNAFSRDLTERMVWTAVEAALGVAAGYSADVGTAWGATIATVVATLVTFAKGMIARRIGDPDSASTLRPVPPVPPEVL